MALRLSDKRNVQFHRSSRSEAVAQLVSMAENLSLDVTEQEK